MVYVWSCKCECVRMHLCIDTAEYHQPSSNLRPYEASSPAEIVTLNAS